MAMGMELARAHIGLFVSATPMEKGFAKAQKRAGFWGARVGGAFRQGFQNAIAAAGILAPGVLLAQAAKGVVDFDDKMTEARINARLLGSQGASEFKKLRDEALRLAGTTMFNPKETAGAINLFVKAGFSVEQTLGATKDAVNLAAAANMGLEASVKAITTQMKIWQLDASKAAAVADVLAAAQSRTRVTSQELAEGLAETGKHAQLAGMDFVENAAMLALMGEQSHSMSKASVGLSSVILRAQTWTKPMKDALRGIGVELDNFVKGDTVQVIPFLEAINEKIKGNAAGLRTVTAIFKQRGREASKIFDAEFGGKKGIEAILLLAETLRGDLGFATKAAAARMENLRGVMLQFKSAVQDLSNRVFLPLIKSITLILQPITLLIRGISLLDRMSFGLVGTLSGLVITYGLLVFPIIKLVGWTTMLWSRFVGLSVVALITSKRMRVFNFSLTLFGKAIGKTGLDLLVFKAQIMALPGRFKALIVRLIAFNAALWTTMTSTGGLSLALALLGMRLKQAAVASLRLSKTLMLQIKTSAIAAGRALLSAAKAVGRFGKALLTTPLGWTVLILGGLALAVIRVWNGMKGAHNATKKWKDATKRFSFAMSELWRSIKLVAAALAKAVVGLAEWVFGINQASTVGAGMKSTAADALSAFSDLFLRISVYMEMMVTDWDTSWDIMVRKAVEALSRIAHEVMHQLTGGAIFDAFDAMWQRITGQEGDPDFMGNLGRDRTERELEERATLRQVPRIGLSEQQWEKKKKEEAARYLKAVKQLEAFRQGKSPEQMRFDELRKEQEERFKKGMGDVGRRETGDAVADRKGSFFDLMGHGRSGFFEMGQKYQDAVLRQGQDPVENAVNKNTEQGVKNTERLEKAIQGIPKHFEIGLT